MLYRICILYHIIPYHTIPYRAISYRTIPYYAQSYHINHTISIISYHIMHLVSLGEPELLQPTRLVLDSDLDMTLFLFVFDSHVCCFFVFSPIFSRWHEHHTYIVQTRHAVLLSLSLSFCLFDVYCFFFLSLIFLCGMYLAHTLSRHAMRCCFSAAVSACSSRGLWGSFRGRERNYICLKKNSFLWTCKKEAFSAAVSACSSRG